MDSSKRTTRQHRSGNSFSVRLPRDWAYARPDQELEIEKRGDELILRPKQPLSVGEFHDWLDKRPLDITDDALVRGLGRPDLWDGD